MSGHTGYHAGLAAEDITARDYLRRDGRELARRWRGRAGEIDLILRDEETVVFVEVKKSRSFASAAHRVSPRQISRIQNTAAEFMSGLPQGQLSDVRFDVALVDRMGRVSIIENAFLDF